MNNPILRTKNPDATKAAILVFIGIFGSLLLKFFTIINEASLVKFVCLSVFVGIVIYFKASILDFSLGLSGIKIKLKPIDAIVAKETEPMPGFIKMEAIGTDDETKLVINSFATSKYTYRYIESIKNETHLPIDTIKDKTNWLLNNDLAIKGQGVDSEVYALTPKGRNLFDAIRKSGYLDKLLKCRTCNS